MATNKFFNKKVSLIGLAIAIFFIGGFAAFQAFLPRDANDKDLNAATPNWEWHQSAIAGGGTAQVIVTDPFHAGYATVGGDSWGVYNTTTAGNDWLPAMKGLGINGNWDITSGDFFFMGMAYSKKNPGRVYAITGKLGQSAGSTSKDGGFGYVSGNSYKVLDRSISGTETTTTCGVRTVRPRCTGNRVIVDYDAGSNIEYIYVATGNGGGVLRSTDDGNTFTAIGLKGTNSGISGMALDPADHTVLYAGTVSSKAYKITGIRGSSSTQQLANAPNRIEEMATIGNSVYAAAYTSGMYKVTGGGSTWTKLGGSFFPGTFQLSAVGGVGNTVYAGGANPSAGQSIARSTDGGTSWSWVPSSKSKINYAPWGTNTEWWLYKAVPRVGLGCFDGGACTYETTSFAVDQFNPNIVYSAGRSGVWKSEDGGDTWRPAVNHLAGTMHEHIVANSGGSASVHDVDWVNLNTPDHFDSVAQTGSAPNYGADTLTLTKNSHTYKLTLGVPRGFTVDGVSVDDEYFRASVMRPKDIDVSDDGQYIYIALFGGGVVVGHLTSGSGTNPPAVTISASPTSITSGGSSTLSWNVSGTTPTCTASGGWSGSKAASGSQSVTPTITTAYTLSCTNSAGSDSKSVTVTVSAGSDTTKPVVNMTSPTDGATVSGNSITVTGTASDNVGVTRVEFSVNNIFTATDTASPYSFNWSTGSLSAGSYTLKLTAYDAASNNASSSHTVTLTVSQQKPGDCNGDNAVDIFDLSILLNNYNQNLSGFSNGDFNGDGKIDVFDLSILLNNYGK